MMTLAQMKSGFVKAACVLCAVFFLTSCETQTRDQMSVHGVSQEQALDADKICAVQVRQDQKAKNPKYLSRWAECKQRYTMPLQEKLFPAKKAQIEAMHAELLAGMRRVETIPDDAAGQKELNSVYEKYDQREEEIGLRVCRFKAVLPDGGTKCLEEQL